MFYQRRDDQEDRLPAAAALRDGFNLNLIMIFLLNPHLMIIVLKRISQCDNKPIHPSFIHPSIIQSYFVTYSGSGLSHAEVV